MSASPRRLVLDLRSPRTVWCITPESAAAIRRVLGKDWTVDEVDAPAIPDGDGGPGTAAAIAAAAGAEIYVGFGLPPGVLAAARGTLRWAHSGTAGVSPGLVTALRAERTPILLTNSAGIHAEPMADWVIAAILYFARGIDRMGVAQRAGRWARQDFTDVSRPIRELASLRLGIFGVGGIGTAVARRGIALGMRVAGVRRRPERGGPPGIAWVGGFGDLARLAAESDVLAIAAPQTGETVGAVGRDVLARLPGGAIVVNVSRGALLDEAALLERLEAPAPDGLAGAALDVFVAEPLPAGHPFWTHPRVLVSPHVSSVTDRFWERETGLIVRNIRRYLAGEPLENAVDLDAGY